MSGRVHWNGVFPNVNKTGKIIMRGKIRHLVLWDGDEKPELVSVNFLREMRKR